MQSPPSSSTAQLEVPLPTGGLQLLPRGGGRGGGHSGLNGYPLSNGCTERKR